MVFPPSRGVVSTADGEFTSFGHKSPTERWGFVFPVSRRPEWNIKFIFSGWGRRKAF